MSQESLAFTAFFETRVPEDEFIISRTDLKGIITYANEAFAEMSGYKVEELVGKPHNIVRHPDMPKSVFKELWETVSQEKNWTGFVKNRRKDGGYYWVSAEVSGVYKNGELKEYKSIRHPVSAELRIKMQAQYDRMCLEENGRARAVHYLTKENIKKVERLAAETRSSESDIINQAITNL
jgi:PAS domain S-box-containing protein